MARKRYSGATRARARLAIVLLCMIASTQAATAAGPPAGTVEGVARDGQQHSLAGVELRLEAADGKVVARSTTDASGNYSFTKVAPGTYRLVGSKTGLGIGAASVTVTSDAGVTAELTLVAQAQQPTEEITVIAQRLAAAQIGIEPQIGHRPMDFRRAA